ncbi:hypothetical protein H4218_005400 [Coemansia sp. IMI 209128]|nr:hypothetical protein H4218_005400 [Coemansia sp. IMI 209128]
MSAESGVMRLPVEVLCLVLAHLDAKSLQQAGGVCRSWWRIVSDDRSWRLAFQHTFTRLPYSRITPTRMPSRPPSWTDSKTYRGTSWRQEFIDRLSLRRSWISTQHKRLEFNVHASSVDKLVVCEKHGWALAVSRAGGAGVKCLPRTGKVFARDAESKDIVFACERDEERRVSAVTTRIDRVFWGLDDGSTTVTHLTAHGALKSRVVARHGLGAPVLDVAGPMDALAQPMPEWAAVYGVAADDAAASVTADGHLYLWSTSTGDLVRVLQGTRPDVPLVKVTWAGGARYVVAATLDGRILVWDLEQVSGPAPAMYVYSIPGDQQSPVVMLAGDPFSDSFIVATEANGVYRMTAAGGVATTFAPDLLPRSEAVLVTAVRWQIDARTRRAPPSATPPPGGPSRGSSEKREPKAHVLRLDFTVTKQSPDSESNTRLLLIGDSQGSLWAFDSDCSQPTARPLMSWPRLHRCAVSAVTANAAIVVTAARDGQVFVLDPLTFQNLCSMRCRGGRNERRGRRPRVNPDEEAPADVVQNGPRQLDPWFWSVHPAIVNEHTRNDVYLAQLLAARTSTHWDRQVEGRSGDALDRGPPAGDEVSGFFALQQVDPRVMRGFPTLVSDVHAGYGWAVVANGTRIQSCFLESPSRTHHERHRKKAVFQNHRGLEREVEEDLASMRLETQGERRRRIESHANRAHVERTFIEPGERLGLDPDEQLAYALWLSSQQESPASSSGEMTEDEQLQYALLLSQTQT